MKTFHRDDLAGDGQWTVVTLQFSDLKGRRIVRSRETECLEYFARQESQAEREQLVT